MKALLAGLVILALAGCGGGSSDLVTKVQQATVKVCGFMPVASTVATVVDAIGGTGGVAVTVATAANGICLAVKPKLGLKSDDTEYLVNGLKIEGCWVENPKCQPDGTLKE